MLTILILILILPLLPALLLLLTPCRWQVPSSLPPGHLPPVAVARPQKQRQRLPLDARVLRITVLQNNVRLWEGGGESSEVFGLLNTVCV